MTQTEIPTTVKTKTMKAIVQEKYGSREALKLMEIDKPVVNDDAVLVGVHAAGVNWADWAMMRGVPYLFRTMFGGLRRPKPAIRGTDVAGTVEAVGKNVRQWHPGDEVFGWCEGAFAEYVCAGEDHFAPKPRSLTFEQAAAVPMAGCAALQALRETGKVRPGQHVLINGASGGIGTFSVQIAKSFGADVTGVCSTRNVDMVRSLGADHVIDYTQEDFTRSEQRLDVIFDIAGNHSLSDCRRALTPTGTLISSSGEPSRWIGPMARILWARGLSLFVRQRLPLFVAM
jgi:NADPH:quinone reductase-like Zn-dependent oxidoreductase